MIRVLLLVLITVLGFWFIGDNIKQSGPGFVWIYFNHYSLETSFWFFICVQIAAVVLFYLALHGGRYLFYYAIRLGFLPKKLGTKKQQQWQKNGRLAYVQQCFNVAENYLAKAVKKNADPLDFAMLIEANLRQGHIEKAQAYLEKALKNKNVNEAQRCYLSLDVAIASGEQSEIKTEVSTALAKFPKDELIIAKIFHYYCRQQQWQNLQEITPRLSKNSYLASAVVQASLQQMHLGLLQLGAKNHDHQQVIQQFSLYQKNLTHSPNSQACALFIDALLQQEQKDKAKKQLLQWLKKFEYDAILQSLAYLQEKSYEPLWQILKKNLEAIDDNSAIRLLLLARLCQLLQQNEKARVYYRQCIEIEALPAAVKALTKHYEKQGQFEKAYHCLQQIV